MRQTMKYAAVAGALALAVTACGSKSNDSGSSGSGSGSLKSLPEQTSITVPTDAANPAGDGSATCDANTALGYVGALNGPNKQLGINIVNGVKLAIKQHNDANKGCQVSLKQYDTEGDANKAPGVTTSAIKETSIVGIVGLPFSGESDAVGPALEDAGLVHITPSATRPDLSTNGWKTFFRGLANDNVQGPAAAKLADKLGAKKVYLVQDDSAYGTGLGKTATDALGSKLVGTDKVTTGQKDFSATVAKVINAKPDVVFYSGYYAEGAPFDQALVNKGFKGVFIGPDGVKDPAFIQQAGDASSNAYFTCPCLPGDLVPDFADAYKGISGGDAPGTYSLEAYDAATILLKGIDAGNTTRPKLLSFVASYDGQGLSKHFKWDPTGELSDKAVYGYKVQDGKIVSVGVIG